MRREEGKKEREKVKGRNGKERREGSWEETERKKGGCAGGRRGRRAKIGGQRMRGGQKVGPVLHKAVLRGKYPGNLSCRSLFSGLLKSK